MAGFINKSEWDILDILTIINLAIGATTYSDGVENGDLLKDNRTLINDLHQHLSEQDKKIDIILERLDSDEVK